jgi:hypothetical protein
MNEVFIYQRPLRYPAICACGHSEYVYGANQKELNYQIVLAARFFCTSCCLGPAMKYLEESKEQFPWMNWQQRYEWVRDRVWEETFGPKFGPEGK